MADLITIKAWFPFLFYFWFLFHQLLQYLKTWILSFSILYLAPSEFMDHRASFWLASKENYHKAFLYFALSLLVVLLGFIIGRYNLNSIKYVYDTGMVDSEGKLQKLQDKVTKESRKKGLTMNCKTMYGHQTFELHILESRRYRNLTLLVSVIT